MTDSQFTSYFTANEQALLSFAKRFTNNVVDAQDLVQETALKAYKGRNTFREGTSFKSWAFTILRNAFITKYNKRKKRNTVSAPVEDMIFAIDRSSQAENGGERTLQMEIIEASINELSYKTRMPMLMHIEGYQYDEIAERLNIPMGTVKSRINFARKKLKATAALNELVRA